MARPFPRLGPVSFRKACREASASLFPKAPRAGSSIARKQTSCQDCMYRSCGTHACQMKTLSPDPVETLALLPLVHDRKAERQWLQNTLTWLKSYPKALRTERLRALGDAICSNPAAKQRFQQIWVEAFAPRLFSEAGLPEGTSLAREFVARLKKRLIPQLEDELDLYAALDSAELSLPDANWIAGLTEEDSAPWRELLGGSISDLPVAIRLLAVRA